MNSWGWFVITLGLIMVIMAVRNSLANLAPLVPGSGGTLGATGSALAGVDAGLAASGPGAGPNSRIVPAALSGPPPLPTPAGLYTPPVRAA